MPPTKFTNLILINRGLMTTSKLSTHHAFVPFEKTADFRRQRIVACVFAVIALGAAVVFVKGCGQDFMHSGEALYSTSKYSSDGSGFWGFIVMVAAAIVARAAFSRDGGPTNLEQIHSAVISEHVSAVDPGAPWKAWSLSWAGGWCGLAESVLLVYSFERDMIVTVPLDEIIEVVLSQRQISAESQFVGGAVGGGFAGVGGGTAHTHFISSWVLDVYVNADASAHLPLSFGSNEQVAKEVYGQFRRRGCACR